MANEPEDNELPDDGFVFRREARTTQEAVTAKPHGRDINMAKAVVQKYLEGWLTPDTSKRALLERFSPRSAQFVLNREGTRNVHFETGISWETDDPTLRRVQLARFFEQVTERYPMILLIDGGFRNRVAGLGDIQGGRMVGGLMFDVDLVTNLVINMEIVVGALDESTCSDLVLLVSQVIGSPLRRFGDGNHLTSNDEFGHYQITLPLENSPGALSREGITDDPANSKWSSSISVEVEYDAVTSLRTGVPAHGGATLLSDAGASIGEASPGDNALDPTISGPSTITLRSAAAYQIIGPGGYQVLMKSTWRLVVSDHRFAYINAQTLVLQPRRPGTIELRLIDTTRTETGDDGHVHPKVMSRLEVTIKR